MKLFIGLSTVLIAFIGIVYTPVLYICTIRSDVPYPYFLEWINNADVVLLKAHYPTFWWWFLFSVKTLLLADCLIIFFSVIVVFYVHSKLLDQLYKRASNKKIFLRNAAVSYLLVLMILGICGIEFFLHNRITVGMFVDEIIQVDSVVNYKWTFCDSLGINRITPNQKNGINTDGFVSEFEYDTITRNNFRKSGKKIIFVVGDSFVEGVSTSGRDSTIVAHLKRDLNECAIYNFGNGGSDPLNYELILNQYVPALKPDMVLLVFCNNDQMFEDRIPTPNIPLYYQTNFIRRNNYIDTRLPHPDSVCYYIQFESPDSVYAFLIETYSYKRISNKLLQAAMKHSAILTSFYRMTLLKPYYSNLCKSFNTTQSYAYEYLARSKQICEQNHAAFQMVYVPGQQEEYNTLEAYGNIPDFIFRELKEITTFPLSIKPSDYISKANPHFNDSGNRKYAELCKDIIKEAIKDKN